MEEGILSKMFEVNEAIYMFFARHAVMQRPTRLPHNEMVVGLFPETLNCPSMSVRAGYLAGCHNPV